MDGGVRYQEIVSFDDDLLVPFLDLYQTAFPLNEQVKVSTFLRALRGRMRGESPEEHLLAAVDEQGAFLGLAVYEVRVDGRLVALWYLATVPEVRCTGVGARLYHEVIRRSREGAPDASVVLLEVEIPELCEGDEHRQLAERRIGFYRRNGALLLTGVRYVLDVGWQPPIPMHVMLHPLQPITPELGYELSRALFADAIEQNGPLLLG